MEKNEVRAVIKYLCIKKLTTQDIHCDLEATLGESAPPYSTVARWASQFRVGRTSTEDEIFGSSIDLRNTHKKKERETSKGRAVSSRQCTRAQAVAIAAIQQAGFELVDHPPYSLGLVPSNFYLFPKLKEYLRGNRYEDDNEVMDAIESFLQDQDRTLFLRSRSLAKALESVCRETRGLCRKRKY
ncbi:uncharacterized protein LOC119628955 [Bombyx mori]|uniref:Mos1 transposase HTH domain-containing protein n=1 Tax=Bombyx mori TaxID=7091 RepID=A0A8R2QU36_BOMMO|nr:uncharacterized protein LOC119628955 [Bombyx mori]